MSSQTHDPDFVQSLERGLAVITAFGHQAPSLTLTEIAERTGLTRATARRFLLTLRSLGYVESDGKHFSLRPKTLNLGYAYLASLPVWEVAKPHMRELADKVMETISASVLEDTDIVFVARVEAGRIMNMTLGVGARLPAFATAMGRVMLADLDADDLDRYFARATLVPLSNQTITDESRLREIVSEVRERGSVLVDQEVEEGVRSLAVPIMNSEGRTEAALTVCSHAYRVSVDQIMSEFLPLARDTADRIGAEIAHR